MRKVSTFPFICQRQGITQSFVGVLILVFLLMPIAPAFAQEAPPADTTGSSSSDASADSSASDTTDTIPTDLDVSTPSATPSVDLISPDSSVSPSSPSSDETSPSPDISTDTSQTPSSDATQTDTDSPELSSKSNTKTAQAQSDMVVGSSDSVPTFDKQLPSRPDYTSGGLIYEFPIATPPGRNGIQPSLTLEYNSQTDKDGDIFGYGWNVNIPYIQRVNKHGSDQLYSYDDYYSSLGGDLATTTTAGIFVAHSDDGSFLQYTFSTSTNGWTATDKNGIQYTFATTSAGRQDDPGDSTHIYKWMLTEMRDTNGNYATYQYYKDGGQIYPSSITYTNDATSTGPFEIDFLRESRSDVATSSLASFFIQNNYRINEIDAKINGTWATKYALGYTTGDNGHRSLLSTITKSGQDSQGTITTLPANTFTYQTSAKGWAQDTSWSLPTPEMDSGNGIVIADVNGDGLSDIVRTANYGTGSVYNNDWINDGDGTWTDMGAGTWAVPLNMNYPGTGFADFNGDGLADIYHGDDGSGGHLGSEVYMNTGSGWVLSSSTIPVSLVGGKGKVIDVNGDGLADIIFSPVASGSHFTALNNGDGTWTAATTTWDVPEAMNDLSVRVIDINGDGLPDILRSDQFNNKVYLNNGHGWTLSPTWSLPCTLDYTREVVLADINGDGLPDIIRSINLGSPSQDFYINNGDGTWTDESVSGMPWYFTDVGTGAADLNGDGMVDLYRGTTNAPSPINEVDLHVGRQTDLLAQAQNPTGGALSFAYKASPTYRSGSALLNPSLPYGLVTLNAIGVNNGAGTVGTTTYSYKDGLNYFASTRDHKLAGFGTVTQTDPDGNVTKSYFDQGNATDSSHGEYADDVYKIGKMYRQEKYDGSSNLYEKTINKWDEFDLSSSTAAFVKLAQTLDSAYDGSASTHKDKTEQYTYDNSTGNLTEKTQWGQVTGSDDGTFSDTGNDKFVTDYSYASTTGPQVLDKISDETLTNQSGTKVSETRHYYDGLSLGSTAKGNETKTETWKSSSSYASTTKTYNSYGLVATSTDAIGSPTGYAYDSYFIYPATTTNALAQAIGRTYNYLTGAIKETYDPNGRLYQTTYDGLGRTKEIKQPDINTPSTLVTKTAYTYADNVMPSYAHHVDYLNSATSTDTYDYLDGFGRLLQSRKTAETGNMEVKDYAYDARGLLASESLPYFSTGASSTVATSSSNLLTTYSYDPLSRQIGAVNAVGTTATAYAQWKTTVTDPRGKTKDLYDDAYGNLAQVDEHNGTSTYSTYYTYNGLNKLTNITDALGNVRNFTYDGMGRRTGAEDLHAPGDGTYGTWNYAYDDGGNLIQTVDPKSQTVNYTYDVLDRQLTEDYAGLAGTEALNTYDSCSDGKGRLCTASSTNALISYAYNPVGQIKIATSTIIGTSTPFATQYDYDRQGNQILITYPDSSQVQYLYNAAGLLDSVQKKESGDTSFANVVNNFDYSPTGKPSLIQYANGDIATSTYDPDALYRLKRVQTKNAAGLALQDISYTYDADGNITGLSDVSSTTAAKTATYTYDDLNRLTQAQITAGSSTTPGDWYNSSWGYRIPVTASSTKVLADTKDVYVDLSLLGGTFNSNVKPNGCDIRVTKSDGATELPIDLVSYASSTGQLDFSTGNALSTTTGTLYYVYFGNPSASCYAANATYGAQNVYDSNTKGVWHLEESTSTAGGIKDSTANGHNGTMYSNFSPGANGTTTGKLGSAANFNGTNDSIDIPDSSDFEGNAMTIEAWVRMAVDPATRGEQADIVAKKNTVSPWVSYNDDVDTVDRLDGTWVDNTGTQGFAGTFAGSMATSTWYYTVLRHDPASSTAEISVRTNGSNLNTYVASTSNGTTYNSNDVLRFGADYDGGNRLDGSLDEIRVHNTALSDNYIATRYNNMNSPSTFWSVASSSPYVASTTGGYTQTYSYNAIGDITNKSDVGSYAYAGTGDANPHAATTINGQTYAYDNDGNLTSGGGASNAWDYRNRLTQSGTGLATSTYSYDNDINRVKLTENGVTTLFPNDLYNVMLGGAGTTTKNIMGNGLLLATVEKSSAVVSTSTATTTTYLAYSDSLQSGWDNWSWNSTQDFATTSVVYSGTDAIAETYTAAYGGLYLHNAGLSTATSTHLHLAFRSPTASPFLQVLAYDNTGNPTGSTVNLASYIPGGTIAANTWYTIDIPLSALAASNITLTGIVLQKDSTGLIYYDDIKLEAVSGGDSAGAVVRYNHQDILNSTNVVTDSSGNLAETLDYYPFGGINVDTKTGTYAGEKNKYIGEEYDAGTGLNYLNARYYKSTNGQFISEDSAFLGDPKDQNLIDPQSLNSYSYADDNPTTLSDPNGKGILSNLLTVLALLSYYAVANEYRLDKASAPNGQLTSAQSTKYDIESALSMLSTAGEGLGLITSENGRAATELSTEGLSNLTSIILSDKPSNSSTPRIVSNTNAPQQTSVSNNSYSTTPTYILPAVSISPAPSSSAVPNYLTQQTYVTPNRAVIDWFGKVVTPAPAH